MHSAAIYICEIVGKDVFRIARIAVGSDNWRRMEHVLLFASWVFLTAVLVEALD
jgi:hypothetical protein